MSEKYIVPAVVNAMNILNYFVEHKEASLIEVSKDCKINKSSCFRILKTFDYLGYIAFDANHNKYRIGDNFHTLTGSDKMLQYKSIAEGYLDEARTLMENSCGLLQKVDMGNLQYVARSQMQGDGGYIYIVNGKNVRITTGAHGKCFMAAMSDQELEKIIAYVGGLTPFTKYTITDIEELKKELELVNKAGFAISMEETALGVSAVSSPIYGPDGKIIFALSCLILANQTNKRDLKRRGILLREITERISAKIKETTS